MIKLPLVSVITVVYNSENHISDTIESVLNQDYENVEYVIIDGGSTDATISKIEKYKEKIQILISEKDSGIFFAMNKALNLASGDWVVFINSGDKFHNRKTLSNVFLNRDLQDIDLLYGDVILYDPNESYLFKSKTNKWKINLNAICHQSVFIRRIIHNKFDTKYKIAADHAIIYPLIKSNKVLYLNLVLSEILIGGVSSNLPLARKEKFMISFNEGGLFDMIMAGIIFLYNASKEFVKILVIKFLPYSAFQRLRKYKNQLEQF